MQQLNNLSLESAGSRFRDNPVVGTRPTTGGPTIAGFKAHSDELHMLNRSPTNNYLTGLLTISDQLKIATEKPVTFRKALFWQENEPAIWPRTITLIQGQTGVHKSRVAELFGSSVLAEGPNARQGDSLGIRFEPADGEEYKLLYVDTERNLADQLPSAIQNLKTRAGYDFKDHPHELLYTSLVQVPRNKRFEALVEFLDHHRKGFDGHLIVILDVLSDCVGDFNDVAGSLALMDMLNVAINGQNVSFIAVLHENPGTGANKARGHLGTEASNKASTVLQVSFVKEKGKTTELLQLLYLKRRYAAGGCTFFATLRPNDKGPY